MFFFFFGEDFDRELREFVLDPKLQRECDAARQQQQAFCDRYPLSNLPHMTAEEYFTSSGSGDDFCQWITKWTNRVVVPPLGTKHDIGRSEIRNVKAFGTGKNWVDEDLRNRLLEPLYRFVRSEGKEYADVLEDSYGTKLLQKILYLYLPNLYMPMVNPGWIERVAFAFGIKRPMSVFDCNRAINEYLEQHCRLNKESFPKRACVAFLNEWFGLSGEYEDFKESLIKEEGLSDKTAEELSRAMRQLSRLLVGYSVCKKPLKRDVEFISRVGCDRGALSDALNRIPGLCTKKIDEFGNAFGYYIRFLDLKDQRRVVDFAPSAETYLSHQVSEEDKKRTNEIRSKLKSCTTADEVVSVLCESGRNRQFCRHYTTFSAFLSIASAKRPWMLRLTRGDDPNMNDQLEWKRLGDVSCWKRTFITSFSGVQDESAAMWGLYGKPNNEALRLSFTKGVIRDWISSFKGVECVPQIEFAEKEGYEKGPFSVTWDDVEVFWGDVLYGGDLKKAYKITTSYLLRGAAIQKNVFSAFNPPLDKAPQMTGFIKSADWCYEDECRLIVRIKPETKLHDGRRLDEVKYVYVPLPEAILRRVSFMQGPCIPEKLRPVVREGINKLLPDVLIEDSKYKDNLKFK